MSSPASPSGIVSPIYGYGAVRGGSEKTRSLPTIRNNVIAGNSGDWGGGVLYCNGSIEGNTVSGNSALYGGGLYGCDGVIRNNTITGNSARHGGAFYACHGHIQDNIISDNSAEYDGGGFQWCSGTIEGNTVSANSAVEYGGGCFSCGGTIRGNIISGNTAAYGGGLSRCGATIQNNLIFGNSATDGGGLYRCDGTIENNTVYGNIASSRAGGGWQNTASGDRATVAGGTGNAASGFYATVPGGVYNEAIGDQSFAAGRRAIAKGAGSFVWGDSNDFNVHAWGANEFVVRATGGYWLFSGVDGWGNPTAGATLAAGSGTWGSWCDRNAKTDCVPADSREVLEKVAALPISTWSYKTQDPSVRHMGPMAQDFYAAFGLAEDDKRITTVDADGVSLAAIQGLHEMLREKDAKISTLESRITALESLVARLAERQARGEE